MRHCFTDRFRHHDYRARQNVNKLMKFQNIMHVESQPPCYIRGPNRATIKLIVPQSLKPGLPVPTPPKSPPPQLPTLDTHRPDHEAQSVGLLTRKSGVVGSISGLATYFRFSFRFFKKSSCQLLAKVCARSTG